MRIKHGTPEDRPKMSDRAKQPLRNTSRKGTGSMCKRIIDPKPTAAGHETNTNQEREASDD